jgi:hypothetical protein
MPGCDTLSNPSKGSQPPGLLAPCLSPLSIVTEYRMVGSF